MADTLPCLTQAGLEQYQLVRRKLRKINVFQTASLAPTADEGFDARAQSGTLKPGPPLQRHNALTMPLASA